MHLSFQAAQIDASRAGESFIHLHPNMLKLHKDASEEGKATFQIKGLKAVYKRVQAMEKKKG
jgi:hypothetical protein